jgi:putative hemolysin
MLDQTLRSHQSESKRFVVELARNGDDIREAQRLRFKVFAQEMGARIDGGGEEIDRDLFDRFCDHLVVRDTTTNEVVGTYRILTPDQAKRVGGYYSDDEFDLTRLAHLRNRMVEVGRSCVHPDYRSGGVVTLLWSGLARYMRAYNYDYLMGCASISMADGGHAAAGIYSKLQVDCMSPIEWRVFPRCPLPLEALDPQPDASMPPLIKGYMRVGAYVCGDPAWDPDFNTADLLLLLPMSRVNTRYANHFLK